MKKFLSAVLVIALILSLSAVALADTATVYHVNSEFRLNLRQRVNTVDDGWRLEFVDVNNYHSLPRGATVIAFGDYTYSDKEAVYYKVLVIDNGGRIVTGYAYAGELDDDTISADNPQGTLSLERRGSGYAYQVTENDGLRMYKDISEGKGSGDTVTIVPDNAIVWRNPSREISDYGYCYVYYLDAQGQIYEGYVKLGLKDKDATYTNSRLLSGYNG